MWLNSRNTHCLLHQAIIKLPDREPLEELARSKAIDDVLPAVKRVLQNNPKNAANRQKLAAPQISCADEIVNLDNGIRAETAVLSDEFDLDELEALDLVLTGEAQSEIFDNVGRGLCAVLCYYDNHRYQTGILAMLLSLHGEPDIPPSLTTSIESLMNDRAVFSRLLDVVSTFTVKNELERLSKPTVNGVGSANHKKLLIELMTDIRRNCFTALYNLSLAVSNELAPAYLTSVFQKVREIAASSVFDDTSLSLWTIAQTFIIPPRLARYPDPKSVLEVVHDQLYSQEWKDATLAATVHLNYTVGLKSLASRTHLSKTPMFASDMSEERLDLAIGNMALQFIRDYVLPVPEFKEHHAYPHIIDCIVKALCTYFPEKLHELLRKCDGEIEHIEECGITNLTHVPPLHYRALIDIMASLYSLEMPEMVSASDHYFSNDYPSLHHFLACGRQVSNPVMLVAFLNMMNRMCRTESAAITMYYFFKKRGHTDTLSWDQFFSAVRNYLNLFSGVDPSKVIMGQAELTGLIVWVRLAENLCSKSEECRVNFLAERGFLLSLIGLVASPVHTFLKGSILRLLAALAIDAEHASQIWHGLFRFGIISVDAEGTLQGLPKDLELKESVTGRYDCCRGFLKLMENLCLHGSLPPPGGLAPYLGFITKTVICGSFSRNHQDINEKWSVLSSSFNILYNICSNRGADVASVKDSGLNIAILTQMLTPSLLLDAIKRTLFEGVPSDSPEAEREAATSAALRLLQEAVLQHGSLKDALRLADSTVKISNLDEIFLSTSDVMFPDGHFESLNLYALLCPYISTAPELLHHANYALDIMHKLTFLDPSRLNQMRYREALENGSQRLAHVCAELTSIDNREVSYTFGEQGGKHDYGDMSLPELRGFAFSTILEIICRSLETCPKDCSIGSLLLGCDDITKLEETFAVSCMKGILSVIEESISEQHPWSNAHVGLFEKSLRVVDRLVAPQTRFSVASLTYLRGNSDLIYSLMLFVLNGMAHVFTAPTCSDVPIIQGTALNLIAMEISSLVMQGKFDQAERFYHYLLMPGSNGDENAMSSVDEDAEAPLWYAFKEMEHNEHPNQAAILHLFTGQMALVNVVALFADIGFYDQRRALYSLCDGIVNHVVDFATQLELSESVTDVITGCLFRMVQTISKLSVLFVEELPDGHIHSDCFAVLDTLIKFFVNPSNFLTVSGKVDMYGAIFQMLHTIRRLQSIVAQSIQDVDGANPNLTAIEMRTRLDNSAPLQKLIEQSGTYLVQCFNSDIASSVSSLKLIAVSCITELIHDDCDATENVIECLIRNGCIRFLLESLCTPDMMKPAQTEYVDKVVMYINSVLALFSRIAITPPGMQALTELGALSRLEKFPFWQQPSSDMLRKLLSPPDVAKPVLPSA